MLRSLLNQRLGRYLLTELLGRGGMAAVYRAADTVLQRDIALKVLYPQYSDDATQVERFKREAVTAASLEHPNIVPVYDVGEHNDLVYIAMKLLCGRTLHERLQEVGLIGLDELIAVLGPVAAALDYAHGRGVIHRDIKPGNLFLSQESDGVRPVLTDFGIAKQLDTPGLTTTGALIGTPDYMAPEQIAGKALGPQVDIYALGMLAFRSLTGRRAFEGSTQDVLLGHLYGQPPLVSELNPALPPGLDAVVGTAIATDPAARFASAGAFVQALSQVASRAAAATAVGVLPPRFPPPPVVPRSAPPLPPAQNAQRLSEAPSVLPSPQAAGATVAQATLPRSGERARAQQPSGTVPWVLVAVLALLTGGLAVALTFVMRERGATTAGETLLPPSATPTLAPTLTAAPSSPTSAAALLASVTSQATATSEPTATSEATATTAPTRPALKPPTALIVPPPASLTPVPTLMAPTQVATITPVPSPAATVTHTPTPAPSATSVPTASASTTPVPTAVAVCDEQLLDGGFARVYAEQVTARRGLGCPLAKQIVGAAVEQLFENGVMFWWSAKNGGANADSIFALMGLRSGRYAAFSADEVAALGPEPTPNADPYAPIRGFGRVYYYRSEIGAALGHWTSPEIELKLDSQPAVMQLFAQGLMIWTPLVDATGHKSIFVLYYNGTSFERYDDPLSG